MVPWHFTVNKLFVHDNIINYDTSTIVKKYFTIFILHQLYFAWKKRDWFLWFYRSFCKQYLFFSKYDKNTFNNLQPWIDWSGSLSYRSKKCIDDTTLKLCDSVCSWFLVFFNYWNIRNNNNVIYFSPNFTYMA